MGRTERQDEWKARVKTGKDSLKIKKEDEREQARIKGDIKW